MGNAILRNRLRLWLQPEMIPAQRLFQLVARDLGELPHQPVQRPGWIGSSPYVGLSSHSFTAP